MCIETIEVRNLNSARDAYEISQYLEGIPHIDDAKCNFLNNNLTVDYDESKLSHQEVLDEIEYAGCTPAKRHTGIIGRIVESVDRNI